MTPLKRQKKGGGTRIFADESRASKKKDYCLKQLRKRFTRTATLARMLFINLRALQQINTGWLSRSSNTRWNSFMSYQRRQKS